MQDSSPPAGHRVVTTQPQIPQHGFKPSPFRKGAPKYQYYTATIAAGVQDAFHADFEVEAWLIAVFPAASVRVNMGAGPTTAGPSLPFGGGGNAVIPGDGGGDLAYNNVGATTATVVAIATCGYAWSLTYDPGDLA